jgi:hypothetical protein
MSQWTHVCGSIRYDAIRLDRSTADYCIKEINKLLGTPWNYDDFEKEGFVKPNDIPSGSEGSIQYKIYENPELNHITSFNINIWGDLRDFTDLNEIKTWVNRIVNIPVNHTSLLGVRSMALIAYTEASFCNSFSCIFNNETQTVCFMPLENFLQYRVKFLSKESKNEN